MKPWFHPGMKETQCLLSRRSTVIIPEPQRGRLIKIHWQQSVAKIIRIRQQAVESVLEAPSQLGYWPEHNEPRVLTAASRFTGNERTTA
jgi:hypothetical protein